VVHKILMIQNQRVTSGTLLNIRRRRLPSLGAVSVTRRRYQRHAEPRLK
jgi:hypothetical protein